MIDYEKIRLWLASAKPGSRITYHTGNGLTSTPAVKLIRSAFDRVDIELAQRRVGKSGSGAFEYLAIKRKVRATDREQYFAALLKGEK